MKSEDSCHQLTRGDDAIRLRADDGVATYIQTGLVSADSDREVLLGNRSTRSEITARLGSRTAPVKLPTEILLDNQTSFLHYRRTHPKF